MIGVDYASVDGNTPPIWKSAKGLGVRFAILRASTVVWDKKNRAWHAAPDQTFQRDWEGLRKARLVRGAYMFPVLQAPQSPEAQVAMFVQAVEDAGGLSPGVDFPPILDVEFPGGIAKTNKTRNQCLDWITRAVEAFNTTLKIHPMIYTSARVWDSQDSDALDADAFGFLECPLWLARYPYKARKPAVTKPPEGGPPVPKYWGDNNWWIHQYQGDALGLSGFSSTVDLNKFHMTKEGDKGGHVEWLQRKLQISADGVFGPKTAMAVKVLQKAENLIEDAVVGPGTFAALSWLT